MRRRRGFSLVELVMIMIIISILSAIAVPRLSQAGVSAQAKALVATISNVRESMELYFGEHGRYPGYDPSNGSPDGDEFQLQMLEYSDDRGRTRSSLAYPYIYGPYLRNPFPSNPFNGLNTVRVVPTTGVSVPLGSSGWIAVLATGEFRLNATAAEIQEIGVTELDSAQITMAGE